MSTSTQDTALTNAAGRAIHAALDAAEIVHLAVKRAPSLSDDGEVVTRLLSRIVQDIASLYQDILAMEALDTKRVLMIADLKTRLGRAAENNEELYRLTAHAVGDATERHLIVSRNRALLDLETPLPPRLGGLTPSTNGCRVGAGAPQ